MAITGEPTRRLIEEWLPINEISIEAIRERAGAVPNPAPHQLHVWWAHPEILCRLAQMTPLCRRQSIQSQYAAYNVKRLLTTSLICMRAGLMATKDIVIR